MKRFRFDLEKLLSLRLWNEREAEEAMARAMGEVSGLEGRLKTLAQEMVEVARGRFARGKSVDEMRASELYLVRLDKTKEGLLEALAKASLVLEEKRTAYLEALKERKVLDKLKEKRRIEHRKAALREETAVLDEVSMGSKSRKDISEGENS